MEDFKLFDILPNGIIVFKDKKVEYVNRHILDVFNIGFFSKKNSIKIILETISLGDEEKLYYFFSERNHFTHHAKVIQIEHTRYNEFDIFAFTLINPSLTKIESNSNMKKSEKINIDQKIAEHLKLNNIRKVGVLTFYKGIPLKNIGEILRVNKDSIEIVVDSKHKISLLERDDILLIVNKNKEASALHGHVFNSSNNIFSIKNFTLTKNDMHLRNSVRIKPEQDLSVSIDKKEYIVYDISEKGISINIDNIEDEEFLKKQKSMDLLLLDNRLHINIKYLKTIYNDNGDILKIIFLMFNESDAKLNIHKYIINRQNGIIREIHMYRNQDQ